MATPKTKLRLFDRGGESIVLLSELGRGGEGSVHEVKDRPDLVAKIYDTQVDREKTVKLAAMADHCNERLLGLAAWPIDILRDGEDGSTVGFLMQRIKGHKGIHVLYSPKSRLNEFPNARWTFLIHAATNLARAFAVIHEHGHVIGDVNHGNVLVSAQATTKLIDCDSFQIDAEGKTFPCQVGVSTHTPPELQGLAFKDVIRTVNHDCFGLSVLIFQLLFMGRHPFSGEFSGSGEMSIERAIREYRFAYGKDTASRGMKQPPGSLPLSAVSGSVASLFNRAFLSERDRPSPIEWIEALEDLSQTLNQCFYNGNHVYLKSLVGCPWCEIELKAGVPLFNLPGSATPEGSFSLPTIWRQIETMALPESPPLPTQPSFSSLLFDRDAAARKWRMSLIRLGLPIVLVLFVAITVSIVDVPIDFALAVTLLFGTAGIAMVRNSTSYLSKEQEQKRTLTEANWNDVKSRWLNEKERQQFRNLQKQMKAKKTQYMNLSQTRQDKLKTIEAGQRRRQLYEYLDQYHIVEADIPDVDGACRDALLEHGIDTAAKVDRGVIVALGGIGASPKMNLLEWRNNLANDFVFQPADQSMMLQSIDTEIITQKSKLERDLQAGQLALRRLFEEIKTTPETLRPMLDEILSQLAQFESSARFGAGSGTPMALLVVSVIISILIVVMSK